MENLKNIEKNLDKCQAFIFNLRKFFSENPDLAAKLESFLEKKENEELIF